MAKAKIEYYGDINPEHGGYFYSLKDVSEGFASVVQIAPASDAGLAENEYWIECLTVNFPTDAALESEILSVIGLTVEEVNPQRGTPEFYATMINACIAYGHIERDSSEGVRIGKPDPYARQHMDEETVKVTLRAGSKIGNYARKVAREYV